MEVREEEGKEKGFLHSDGEKNEIQKADQTCLDRRASRTNHGKIWTNMKYGVNRGGDLLGASEASFTETAS